MNVVLVVLAILFLAPLVYILFNSFKPAGEIFQVPQSIVPKEWTFENYIAATSKGFIDYFRNSVVITVGGVALTVLLSSLAGYAESGTAVFTPDGELHLMSRYGSPPSSLAGLSPILVQIACLTPPMIKPTKSSTCQ